MDERQTAQEAESGLILGSIRGRLVRGSAWVLAGRILSIVAGVAVNALLSRILTPAELGDYFLAFTIVLFASTLAELGMDIAIVRFVAGAIGIRQFGQARAAIRAVLRCVLVATLAVMAVMALGPGHLLATHVFHSTALAQIMGLASLWTAGLVFRSIFAEAFRGMHDLRFATLFEGLLTTILMAVLFGVVWLVERHSTLQLTVLLSMVAAGTSALIAVPLLRPRVRALGGTGGQVASTDILKVSWPFLVSSLVQLVLGSYSDLWVLAAFRTHQDVAVYGAAVRLLSVVSIPFNALRSVFPPVIAELHAQGRRERLELAVRASTTLVAIPIVLAVALLDLLAAPVLGLVYGPFYRAGASVLVILSISQVFNVLTGPAAVTLAMTGHQRAVMVLTMIGGAVSLAGDLIAVRPFGSVGVAVGTMIGVVITNLIGWATARRQLGIWTHPISPLRAIRILRAGGLHAR